jgi:molybdopterin molybdotransferase
MAGKLISIEQARKLALAAARPLEHETVAIAEGLGRVLARDVVARGDVPPFPSSAMDGYALKAGPASRSLTVIAESRAGSPAEAVVADGEVIRVSTGAAVPEGAEAVIRQEDVEEDVEEDGSTIRTTAAITPGTNVRRPGEDLRAGEPVLRAGSALGPAELGAAVAAGAAELVVARRPTVAIQSTGDELRAPGEPLGPGEIHNSNAPMLMALTVRAGAIALPPERLPDDRSQTETGLARALESADVVVVSGGVSVGPHDHVRPALEALKVDQRFWGVALKPGKPTWFGERDGKLVFGLPGNPVSAVVTFTLFVRPALAALMSSSAESRRFEARLGVAVERNPVREQAVRVRLEDRDSGVIATPNGAQDSHLVTSLLGADGLAFIPAGQGELPPGATVKVEILP